MPIRVQCPQCGKEYNVGDDKAGRRFQCKGCQAPVVVPTSSAAAEDDPFGGMDEDFGNDMAQPARPGGAKSASLSKKGKGKGKKSKQSGGNGALLGIGIGAAAIVIVAAVVFFFTRGNGGDDPAPPANGGSGGNVAANNSGGGTGATAQGGTQTTTPAPGPMVGEGIAESNAPTNEPPRPTAAQLETIKGQLHDIALAMHNHHDVWDSFPFPSAAPAERRDAQGQPHLSWRVYLLPYLDQGNLYERFHLDEPWDSPHNLRSCRVDAGRLSHSGRRSQCECHTVRRFHRSDRTVRSEWSRDEGLRRWDVEHDSRRARAITRRHPLDKTS